MQVLICQGAGLAVPGLYPLLFPPSGYNGQLRWLVNSCAALGPESYTILLSAAKEGKVCLPKNISVRTTSGSVINIGETLTAPNAKKLKRIPLLSVSSTDCCYEVTHSSVMTKFWPPFEKQAEDGGDEKVRGDGEDEEEEGREDEMLGAVLTAEKQEEDVKCELLNRKVHVEVGEHAISKAELLAHLSNYGEVEDLQMPDVGGHAEVVFTTAGSVKHCLSLEHCLSREHNASQSRGPLRLRMKGGNAPPPAPSRQLQQNLNPFRWIFHWTSTAKT